MACYLPITTQTGGQMSYILIQNPLSPLAGRLSVLLKWHAIYYQPEIKLEYTPLVILWDCTAFAHDIWEKWYGRITSQAAMLALLDSDDDMQKLRNFNCLKVVFCSEISDTTIKENLRLSLISQMRHHEMLKSISESERKLENMSLIGQAKKWLAEHWQLDEEKAHRWLQRQSQADNQKLLLTARKVVQGYYLGKMLERLDDEPDDG